MVSPPPAIYSLSLHDALPIYAGSGEQFARGREFALQRWTKVAGNRGPYLLQGIARRAFHVRDFCRSAARRRRRQATRQLALQDDCRQAVAPQVVKISRERQTFLIVRG